MSKILILKPNQEFEVKEVKGKNIPYEVLRDSVGGLIELYNFSYELEKQNIDCFVDEEYLLKGGLEPTFCEVYDGKIVNVVFGNMVFCKNDEYGGSISLTDDDIALIKDKLSRVCIACIGDFPIPALMTCYSHK